MRPHYRSCTGIISLRLILATRSSREVCGGFKIGPFVSEVLTLGVPDGENECILIVPENDDAVIGGKLY